MHRISCSLTLLSLLVARFNRIDGSFGPGRYAAYRATSFCSVGHSPKPEFAARIPSTPHLGRSGSSTHHFNRIGVLGIFACRPVRSHQSQVGDAHTAGITARPSAAPQTDVQNELSHLFLTDHTGTAHSDLTADYPAGARTAFTRWAEDGHAFFFLSNRRDPKYFDIYEYDIAKKAAQLLWQASGKFRPTLVSSNGERFVILEINSDVDVNLYLWRRGTKRLDLLTSHQGEALFFAEAFSRDGQLLYYVSNQDREFASLYQLDLTSKRSEPLLAVPWDVEGAGFSEGWTYFYTTTNVDGTPRVVLRKGVRGEAVAMPSLGGDGALIPISFSKSDRYVGATRVTDTAPTELYVADPVHYLVIPGEGHGFSKNENLAAALRATNLFLDHYILGDKSGKMTKP